MSNKTCIITGGANGIGRCLVESFVTRGYTAAFIDKDEASGVKLVKHLGQNVLFAAGDIAEENVIASFTRQVIQNFGTIDCLINNACVSGKGILSDCNFADFTYALKVGIAAPYLLTKLLREHFSIGASIINISSTRAFMSQPDTESYSAAKGGISALTHALASSLSGKVRVNAISPGWIDAWAYKSNQSTPNYSEGDVRQHAAGRVGIPEDIAAIALFLASEEAGFITGQNFIVDGGMTSQMIYHADQGWIYQPKS